MSNSLLKEPSDPPVDIYGRAHDHDLEEAGMRLDTVILTNAIDDIAHAIRGGTMDKEDHIKVAMYERIVLAATPETGDELTLLVRIREGLSRLRTEATRTGVMPSWHWAHPRIARIIEKINDLLESATPAQAM